MFFVTQLVYVHSGKEATFHAFEDAMTGLIARHGGELLLRIRPTPDSIVAASIEAPYEIHVVRFRSEEAFRNFSNDEERQRVLELKNQAVRRAILITGTSG